MKSFLESLAHLTCVIAFFAGISLLIAGLSTDLSITARLVYLGGALVSIGIGRLLQPD